MSYVVKGLLYVTRNTFKDLSDAEVVSSIWVYVFSSTVIAALLLCKQRRMISMLNVYLFYVKKIDVPKAVPLFFFSLSISLHVIHLFTIKIHVINANLLNNENKMFVTANWLFKYSFYVIIRTKRGSTQQHRCSLHKRLNETWKIGTVRSSAIFVSFSKFYNDLSVAISTRNLAK